MLLNAGQMRPTCAMVGPLSVIGPCMCQGSSTTLPWCRVHAVMLVLLNWQCPLMRCLTCPVHAPCTSSPTLQPAAAMKVVEPLNTAFHDLRCSLRMHVLLTCFVHAPSLLRGHGGRAPICSGVGVDSADWCQGAVTPCCQDALVLGCRRAMVHRGAVMLGFSVDSVATPSACFFTGDAPWRSQD